MGAMVMGSLMAEVVDMAQLFHHFAAVRPMDKVVECIEIHSPTLPASPSEPEVEMQVEEQEVIPVLEADPWEAARQAAVPLPRGPPTRQADEDPWEVACRERVPLPRVPPKRQLPADPWEEVETVPVPLPPLPPWQQPRTWTPPLLPPPPLQRPVPPPPKEDPPPELRRQPRLVPPPPKEDPPPELLREALLTPSFQSKEYRRFLVNSLRGKLMHEKSCTLCGKQLDDTHVASDGHRKKEVEHVDLDELLGERPGMLTRTLSPLLLKGLMGPLTRQRAREHWGQGLELFPRRPSGSCTRPKAGRCSSGRRC